MQRFRFKHSHKTRKENEKMNERFIKEKGEGSEGLTVTKAKTEDVYAVTTDLEDKTIAEFLNAQKKNTKHVYACYLRRLAEFTTESGSEMLRNHKVWERKIFAYQEFLRQRKYSPNYIESNLGAIRGFFSFYRKPLVLTSQERKKIRQRTRTTEDYEFSSETLAKMYLCGHTAKSRYVVAVAKSIGLRSEDFVSITYGQLRRLDLNAEIPLFLGSVETSKEGVKAYCFLDSDAVIAVKELLAVSADKPDSERVWSYHPKYLSPLLRRLARKAHIEAHGQQIRFHCFRKFLFDNLNTVMSLEKAKQIIGKATSESAYLSPNTLRESFALVMPKITFNGSNGVKTKVVELESENRALKARIQELESAQNKNDNTLSKMRTEFEERLVWLENKSKKKERVPID